MLFNHARALQKMDEYGFDAIVAATPRNFYYASEYWTTVAKWGHQENIFAAIVPRDEDRKAQMVIPEGFFGNLFYFPTWIPAIRPVEMMNTSIIAHEPEPVRLEPFQSDVEEAYAQRVVAPWPTTCSSASRRASRISGSRRAAWLRRPARREPRPGEAAGVAGRGRPRLWLDIRKVKTPEEIERLRTAATINQDAIESIIPMIKPGVVWGRSLRATANTSETTTLRCWPRRRRFSSAPSTRASTTRTCSSPTWTGRCATRPRSSSRAGAPTRITTSTSHARCSSRGTFAGVPRSLRHGAAGMARGNRGESAPGNQHQRPVQGRPRDRRGLRHSDAEEDPSVLPQHRAGHHRASDRLPVIRPAEEL